jgi:hypothetical protein
VGRARAAGWLGLAHRVGPAPADGVSEGAVEQRVDLPEVGGAERLADVRLARLSHSCSAAVPRGTATCRGPCGVSSTWRSPHRAVL